MKSKIRGTPYFLKDFISNDLENINDSLIIAVREEGTPNTSMITTIKPLRQLFKQGQRARLEQTSLAHYKQIYFKERLQ